MKGVFAEAASSQPSSFLELRFRVETQRKESSLVDELILEVVAE